jgi:rhodanese-related sulfurtransferase
MDRREFHRKTLSDLRSELRALGDIEEILKAVLLTAMGSLGITKAFVLVVDTSSQKHHLVDRGLEETELKALRDNLSEIICQYFPRDLEDKGHFFTDPEVITREGPADVAFFPKQIKVLIKWTIRDFCLGLMGFGVRILTDGYSDDDVVFLLSLTDSLIFSIEDTRSASIIRQLGSELREKEGHLKEALRRSEHTRKELDRRLFHLKSFHDITRELAGLRDTGRILETFLLMVLGIFSVGQGYVLTLDREKRSARIACRGIEREELAKLAEAELERCIVRFLDADEVHTLLPASSRVITDRSLLEQVPSSANVKISAVFVVNEVSQGLIGLGEKITQQPFSKQDSELLLTLVSNLSVFLRNTRSFETIQELNLHLEKRNVELEKTVEELRASRSKIEILERTKARIRTSLQKERQRARRVSVMDMVLILGVGLLLGLIYNFSSPSRIDLIPQNWVRESAPLIDSRLAKVKYNEEQAIFVDARPAEFFNQEHIRGAVNLPLALFDFVYSMKFAHLDPQKELIVYGRNISRLYDEEVAFKLASRGHKQVKILSGGIAVWRKGGFPVGPQGR